MKRTFLSLVSMAFICAMTLTSCDEIMSAIDNPVDSYLQVDGPELYVAEGSSIEVACATISDGDVTFTVADAKVAKVEKVEPHMAKVTGLKVGETDVIVKLAATEYYKAAEAKVKIIVKPTYSLKDAVVDGAKLKIGYKLNNEDCEFVYEFDGEKKVFNLLPANSAVPQAMDAYDITMTYDGETTITHKVVSKENISDVPLVLNLYTGGSFDRVFRLANEMKSLQVNGYEILPYVPESVTPVFNITIAPTPDPKVGEKVLLSAGILPGNATNQVLKWSTSDPTKATIDEDGALTALAVGKVTIKCEATDGSGKFDEKEITVEEAGPTLNLTNPAVGQVIGDDGKNYASGSLPSGVKAVAKICYVSGNNGLALALADEIGLDNATAQTTCAAHTPAFTNGTWKLATKDEWTNMINAGVFNDTDLNLQKGESYWSSTPVPTMPNYMYTYNNGWFLSTKTATYPFTRACLAF